MRGCCHLEKGKKKEDILLSIKESGGTFVVGTDHPSSGTTTVMDVVKILFTTPIIWAGLFLVFVLLMDIYLVLGG